jgi:uncharacterized protein YjbI with pentapeptide repeats
MSQRRVHRLVKLRAYLMVLTVILAVGASASLAGVSGAASPSRVRPPKTTVSKLTASPPQLSSSGGTLTLSATVANATSCTFTAKKAVTGLPATVACSSGLVHAAAVLPGNDCCAIARYGFLLTVIGTKTKHAHATVVVPPGATVDCSNLAPAADLEGCDFSNETISHQELYAANLSGANLSGATLNYVDLSYAGLGADLTDTNISNSVLVGTGLVGATLDGTTFTADDLSQASIYVTSLSNVTWIDTTCPDGTNSDSDGGTCVGHLDF